jgi:hypothetical protein
VDSSPEDEEDLRAFLVPLSEGPRLIAEGEITHAIVIAALGHLLATLGRPLPVAASID